MTTPIKIDQRLLAPREIAARWRCKVDRVLTEIHAGRLVAVNIGRGTCKGRYRVDPEDLARYEAARRVQPPATRGRRPKVTKPVAWIQFF